MTMAAPDTDFLKGRNCLLAFRSVETIATIIDWLSYHARTHAATGAVIVNRARPDPAFAEDLASALSSSPKTAGLDLRVVLLDSPVPLGKAGVGLLAGGAVNRLSRVQNSDYGAEAGRG